MKKKQSVLLVHVFLCLFVMSVGCSSKDHQEKDYMALLKATNPTPTNLASDSKAASAKEIKEEVQTLDDIYDVAVVKGEKEVLVVYKVKHLRRFHMKKIEKDVQSRLEKKYPDDEFVVSSDYKIFLEAVRLGEKMKDPNYPKKKAKQELDQIILLKKELT